jgi:hypothetical protein
MSYRQKLPPRAKGFVIEISGRRRVFLPMTRVTAISPGQVITNGLIDLRRFTPHGQEFRAIAEMLGRKVKLTSPNRTGKIEDFAVKMPMFWRRSNAGQRGAWWAYWVFTLEQL